VGTRGPANYPDLIKHAAFLKDDLNVISVRINHNGVSCITYETGYKQIVILYFFDGKVAGCIGGSADGCSGPDYVCTGKAFSVRRIVIAGNHDLSLQTTLGHNEGRDEKNSYQYC